MSEPCFKKYYFQNFPLTISPSQNTTILFSKTIQESNFLNLKFNGILDVSILEYTFTYSFKNRQKYQELLGSIYFQNTVFPAPNYVKITNNQGSVNLIIRIPDSTPRTSPQNFQFDVVLNDPTLTTEFPSSLPFDSTSMTVAPRASTYPAGFEIAGYFLWQGNFTNNSADPITQYYCGTVTAPQTSYTGPSNTTTATGTFTYTDQIPTGTSYNAVFLFTGYSNAASALDNLTNYTTGSDMYTVANDYLSPLGSGNYLISLCLGGGAADTGGWSTGTSGAIYSIYQAATVAGVSFSYQETGTGTGTTPLTGTGTGILNDTYNSLLFDIETWSGDSGSSGQDFINLFNYLKNNANSTFYGYQCVIIVSIAHSCSNFNGTGQSVISTLLSDSTGSYDYIQNQMYTQNIGTTNEYCANYNILWTGSNSFQYYLNQNTNYLAYGNSFVLPAINLPDLYSGPGTNTPANPNLYFYQSTGNTTDPITETASGYVTIPYTVDNGVNGDPSSATLGFFQSILSDTGGLGGYVQWVNGTVA
jgi:hypothetical protein